MDAGVNRRRRHRGVPRLVRDDAGDAVPRDNAGTRADRGERDAGRLSIGPIGDATASHIQESRWTGDSRAVVRAARAPATQPRAGVHAWRAIATDAARLSSDGCVQL